MSGINRRGRVLYLVTSDDGMGGQPEGRWLELRRCWLRLIVPTGRVAVVAQQLQATIDAEVHMRLAADIRAGMRLEYDGIQYKIEAVLPDPARKRMRLLCSSVPLQ